MVIRLEPWVTLPVPLKFPVTLTVVLLVFRAVVLPAVQFPATDKVPAEVVLVPAPEKVRCW